jgi:hypothetical protein
MPTCNTPFCEAPPTFRLPSPWAKPVKVPPVPEVLAKL